MVTMETIKPTKWRAEASERPAGLHTSEAACVGGALLVFAQPKNLLCKQQGAQPWGVAVCKPNKGEADERTETHKSSSL